jgi:hypothetical protein
MKKLLEKIVRDPSLHHQWLYTLSYLENRGAKKILFFQDFIHPTLEVLRHAHEETRHSYFFRKQIEKLGRDPDDKKNLLGGNNSKNYLDRLDLSIMKTLRRELGLSAKERIFASYLLTTYAIEIRAGFTFDTYEKVLRKNLIPITLLSIMKEERNHLREIEKEISKWKYLSSFKDLSCLMEKTLFESWLLKIEKDIE